MGASGEVFLGVGGSRRLRRLVALVAPTLDRDATVACYLGQPTAAAGRAAARDPVTPGVSVSGNALKLPGSRAR